MGTIADIPNILKELVMQHLSILVIILRIFEIPGTVARDLSGFHGSMLLVAFNACKKVLFITTLINHLVVTSISVYFLHYHHLAKIS